MHYYFYKYTSNDYGVRGTYMQQTPFKTVDEAQRWLLENTAYHSVCDEPEEVQQKKMDELWEEYKRDGSYEVGVNWDDPEYIEALDIQEVPKEHYDILIKYL